ncbi:MAG: Zn-dependent protease with chaperone function [Halieaceae bacterium]|jgi:Zn-dependent protease with chaperone function
MDFFAQQDRARRNTRLLLVLFGVAVLALILLINLLISGFIWFGRDYNLYAGGGGFERYLSVLSWERFLTIGIAVAATIALVSMIRWLQLASGGKSIAEGMGGRRILPQTRDRYEKRCLNIVEELALAANMPVPPLYVMPEERGINAFAAGATPADAVVAVTRGALLQLKREELQGVIGHEFSHILNGDMRLGIRLAALLKGITFIGDVGHFLLRLGAYGIGSKSKRSERGAALPLIGLGLMVIGWLGSLAAGVIKAAISRQKEFLADASAVQFTRDTAGIANALKMIGGFLPGTLVHAARAPEMSHIFFGEVQHRLWEGFATHPPLELRIRRLDREWNGQFIERAELRYNTEPLTANSTQAGVGRASLVAAAAASLAGGRTPAGREHDAGDASFDEGPTAALAGEDATPGDTIAGTDGAESGSLTVKLHEVAEEPLGATALALALLVVRQAESSQALAIIAQQGPRGQAEVVQSLLPDVSRLEVGERFPIMATAMPALKSMSTPQYRQFKSTLLAVIRVDQRTDLFEWCLFQLLRHYLDAEYLRVVASRPRFNRLSKIRAPLRQVLSVLAHQGGGDSEAAFAVATASLELRELVMLPLESCSVAEFSRAVNTLADCYPLLKPRILKAMALAAADDGEVCPLERELVVAVAAVMDCPLPPELALQ